MRIRWFLCALTIVSLQAMPALAVDMTPEEIQKMVDEAVNRKLQEHERRESAGERAMEQKAGQPGAQYPTATGPMTDIKVERKGEENVPLGFGSTGSGKLIYAKPFLAAPKATIGGYADFKYVAATGPTLDNPSRNSFTQERMVPFIYADITDRVKFATEIEIERGGPNSPGQNGTNTGSMQLEFAQLDYLVNEAINIRGGILLMPVGKFNLLHDSPLNDLPDRPMVDRLVIPSTWFESGAGIYGTVYPSSLSKLDYELYVVNGMGCNAQGSTITDLTGTRPCRGSVSRDLNDNKGVVGRVAFSPFLGVEIAGSSFYGQYSNRNAAGVNNQDNNIGIYALDWTLQRGPFEVIGEAAWARITGNQGATLTTQGPDGMFGYYIQGNYHFMPEWIRKLAPTHFSEASTFTAVIRWETVDTDTGNKTRLANGQISNQRDLERLTIGLNFRPIEDTVFKFSYFFNTQKNTTASTFVNAPGNGAPLNTSGLNVDGNGFLFMAATYF
ncbi:MAG TPA: hypothetical protein VFR79_06105 [Nitrospira sp.]|nr:hypothetical protein [Nitrospira sp.]